MANLRIVPDRRVINDGILLHHEATHKCGKVEQLLRFGREGALLASALQRNRNEGLRPSADLAEPCAEPGDGVALRQANEVGDDIATVGVQHIHDRLQVLKLLLNRRVVDAG